MPGKYSPLESFLRGSPTIQREITLSFEQVERILNDKLPPSATNHRAWWANENEGSHIHAHSWLNAGWRVDTVNPTQKWVRFVRANILGS